MLSADGELAAPQADLTAYGLVRIHGLQSAWNSLVRRARVPRCETPTLIIELRQFVLFETAIRTGLSRHLNLVGSLWQVFLREFGIEHFQFKKIGPDTLERSM